MLDAMALTSFPLEKMSYIYRPCTQHTSQSPLTSRLLCDTSLTFPTLDNEFFRPPNLRCGGHREGLFHLLSCRNSIHHNNLFKRQVFQQAHQQARLLCIMGEYHVQHRDSDSDIGNPLRS
jgi:hypothetical protein